MLSKDHEILANVATYYKAKLMEHGETARGVDWNGDQSQIARFEQLCKIFEAQEGIFSVNDLGCGYGALVDYLADRHAACSYAGIDISEEMIAAAQRRYVSSDSIRFVCSDRPDRIADYGVASGIFNVRMKHSNAEWKDYIEATLRQMDRSSSKGFSFNCLTSYSDQDRKRDSLYYADPLYFFDFCKQQFSRNVALLHDYDLYEFTVLVKKVV
jgi:SAM-dependent methyltransferase